MYIDRYELQTFALGAAGFLFFWYIIGMSMGQAAFFAGFVFLYSYTYTPTALFTHLAVIYVGWYFIITICDIEFTRNLLMAMPWLAFFTLIAWGGLKLLGRMVGG